jgi:hypothetical protein
MLSIFILWIMGIDVRDRSNMVTHKAFARLESLIQLKGEHEVNQVQYKIFSDAMFAWAGAA